MTFITFALTDDHGKVIDTREMSPATAGKLNKRRKGLKSPYRWIPATIRSEDDTTCPVCGEPIENPPSGCFTSLDEAKQFAQDVDRQIEQYSELDERADNDGRVWK